MKDLGAESRNAAGLRRDGESARLRMKDLGAESYSAAALVSEGERVGAWMKDLDDMPDLEFLRG